jgi:hypothetical protein
VGEVKLTIEDSEYNGSPTFKMIGIGNTYKNWDWFFKVRDKYQCQIDKQTMKPFYFQRDIQEGNYKKYEYYNFNREKNISVSVHQTNQNPQGTDTLSINDCVFDVLSAFSYARNIDFNKHKSGDIIPISVVLDQEIYNIQLKYLGIERLKVKYAGEFECVKFSLSLIAGTMFDEGETMVVWATNDKNHLPVYIESPIIVGSIKVRVSNIKGNRYPFDSFVN